LLARSNDEMRKCEGITNTYLTIGILEMKNQAGFYLNDCGWIWRVGTDLSQGIVFGRREIARRQSASMR